MQQRQNQNCRQDVMTILTTVLDRDNPYAAALKKMHEVEQEQMRLAAENNTPPPIVTMNIMRGPDQRRYITQQQMKLQLYLYLQMVPPGNK
jgi:hypothetical protein